MTQKEIAESIPHEFRKDILLKWLPAAKPNLGSKEFVILWEAYFIYIDPNGVRKDDCPICLNNVLDNWKNLIDRLKEAEQEYNALESL